jgi:hypothetical protein
MSASAETGGKRSRRRAPDDWVQKIAHGYAKQVKTQTGAGWMRAPVRDRPDGPVAYELLLVTRYTDEAHWHFHEQLSLANQDWRAFTSAQAAQQAQQALPINVDDDEEQWVTAIKENICKLLAKGEFTVRAKWAEVYGRTFSLARGMHVRKAIKQLFRRGRDAVQWKERTGSATFRTW